MLITFIFKVIAWLLCAVKKQKKSHILYQNFFYIRKLLLWSNQKFCKNTWKVISYMIECKQFPSVLVLVTMKSKCVFRWQRDINLYNFLKSFTCSSCVRVVFSERSGMGKSLYVQRMAKQLGDKINKCVEAVHSVIPIHGPLVNSDVVLSMLKDHYRDPKCKIYHFDIAPNVSYLHVNYFDCVNLVMLWTANRGYDFY